MIRICTILAFILEISFAAFGEKGDTNWEIVWNANHSFMFIVLFFVSASSKEYKYLPTLFQVMASIFLMDALYEFSLWGLPYNVYEGMSLKQAEWVKIGYLFILSATIIMSTEAVIMKRWIGKEKY